MHGNIGGIQTTKKGEKSVGAIEFEMSKREEF